MNSQLKTMNYKLWTKNWFTLVELIVVITILAILGTIGFLSFLGYQSSARDSMRLADMQLIQRSLEYYKLQSGFYPDPQDFFAVTHSGSTAWKQGVFWEETRIITERLSNVPLDPTTANPYTYSVTHTWQEFQLASVLEGWLFSYQDQDTLHTPQLTPQAHAQMLRARVIGNYNGRIITLYEPNRLIILWVPSIISSEIESVDIEDIYARGSFVLNQRSNLPSSYHNSNTITDIYQWPSFIPWTSPTLTSPVLYDDTIDTFNTPQAQEDFWQNLITYYWGSNIPNNFQELSTSPPPNPLNLTAQYIQGNTWGMNNQVLIAHGDISWSSWEWGNWFPLNPNFILRVDTSYWPDTVVTLPIWWEPNITIDWWNESANSTCPTSITVALYVNCDYWVEWVFDIEISWVLTRFWWWSSVAWAYPNSNKIIWVLNWGETWLTNLTWAFHSSTNFDFVPNNIPSTVTSIASMFRFATNFHQDDLTWWDTSNITSMWNLFDGTSFNWDISNWNTSNVTWMDRIFQNTPFNQDISNWDVSSNTSFRDFLRGARDFNQPLADWETGNVTNMRFMFRGANDFNQDISNWDTSSVIRMDYMFRWATDFNQDISDWDVTSVSDFTRMFANARDFNQDLSSWCVEHRSSEPHEFSVDTPSWILPKPNWWAPCN